LKTDERINEELGLGALFEIKEIDCNKKTQPVVKSDTNYHKWDSQHSHSDHSYAQSETKVKKHKLHSAAEIVYPNEIDHDYVESKTKFSTYIRQPNSALDRTIDAVNKYNVYKKTSIADGTSNNNMKIYVNELMKSDEFRTCVIYYLMEAIQTDMLSLRHRKVGYISYMMRKSVNDMSQMSWECIVSELFEKVPHLFHFLLAGMLSSSKLSNPSVLANVFPKLGFVYSLIAYSFNHELSLVPRILSMLLHDSNCDRVVSRQHICT
jgi:hypothetical protein